MKGKKRLEDAGIQNASQEAESLLAWCMGLERADLWNQMNESFASSLRSRFEECLRRRESREPLQLILGSWDFMGLTFQMQKGIFIPRPETEAIASKALEILKGDQDRDQENEERSKDRNPNRYRILDLGVGSGALLGSLLALGPEKTQGFGIDRSIDACVLASENMQGLALGPRAQIIQGSWFDAIETRCVFDLIVSNPPYLDPDLEGGIQPEVSWDPRASLYAPDKGLQDVRHILGQAWNHLRPGSWLVIETGALLVPRARELARSHWNRVELVRDPSGFPHGLALQRV